MRAAFFLAEGKGNGPLFAGCMQGRQPAPRGTHIRLSRRFEIGALMPCDASVNFANDFVGPRAQQPV
jgi:hypothetical protein